MSHHLANGPAVIQALRHELYGLVAVTPEGGKVARAQAVSPQVESCNVYLPHPAIALWVESFIDECSSFPNGKYPHPAIAPWVEAFIDECSGFPNGKHDDQVDQMTQVLNRLRGVTSPAKKAAYQPPPPSSGDRGW